MKKMKEILVLGGGGFIGRNIVQSLVDREDCNVTAADIQLGSNFKSIKNDPHKSKRFNFIIDDFSNITAFNNFNKKFDEIYMLAAEVGVNKTLKNPHDVIRINTMLTMNTLDWVSRNPVKRILFSSSSENYAGTSDLYDSKIPTDESVPLCISDINHPRWTYAISKIHGESAFIHSAKKLDFECVVVRYQNIIGPEMGFGHAIPHIVERFIKQDDEPIKIYGHDQTRAFCYIDDAVTGTIAAMENQASDGEIYHIGNQEEINIEELTKYIGKLLNYDGKYENAATYPGSVSRRCPDISKAKDDFNYLPKFKWEDAVRLTTEWYEAFFKSGKSPSSGGFEPPDVFQSNED
tara:strand:- start:832 stop:1878 length:1047 start_codon:yes stop_codon:yes gene_type:complete